MIHLVITTLYSPGSSLSYLCVTFQCLILNKESLSSAIDCKLITLGSGTGGGFSMWVQMKEWAKEGNWEPVVMFNDQ